MVEASASYVGLQAATGVWDGPAPRTQLGVPSSSLSPVRLTVSLIARLTTFPKA